MTKILTLLIGIFILISCNKKQEFESNNIKTENTSKTFPEISFEIKGLDNEDFEIITRNDTTFYHRQITEDIDGKNIEYDDAKISKLSAKIKFGFGFLQYTTDDNPASPIQFNKETEWLNLKVENGIIRIPDFYGNSKNIKISEILGFKNNNKVTEWIMLQNFEEIKLKSIEQQANFYNKLLKNRKQYNSCCPEYIEQAEDFLNTQAKEFNTINDLHLELFCNSILIEITGKTKSGEVFRKIITNK